MARLIWTQQALDDFERLLEFIAKDAPIAACRFAEKIIDRVEMLQEHPQLGSLIPEDERRVYRQIVKATTESFIDPKPSLFTWSPFTMRRVC